MRRIPARSVAALCLLAACASAPHTASPAGVLQALVAADNRGDQAAALACYADDAVWLPPEGDHVVGKAAIAERYTAMFAAFTAELALTIDEARADGDRGYVRGRTDGRLVPRAGGAPRSTHDAFVASLRRHDGGWLVTQLMWHPLSREAPAAGR